MVGSYPYARPVGVPHARALLLVILGLLLPLVWQRSQALPAPVAPPAPDVASTLAQLPLAFMPNEGQSDPSVRFQAAGLGGTLQFTPNDVVLTVPTTTPEEGTAAAPHVVRLQFVDANPAPDVRGAHQQPGTVNYFVGNDPQQWRTGLPTYGGLVYEALYPGIDLLYNGTQGHLKGTYTVAPNIDPSRIRWQYAGASTTEVDSATGNLVITLAGAGAPTLTEQAPVAWQDIAGQRVPVTARYQVAADGTIGFALGSYDRTQPLTIDPLLSYSTYLSGSNYDVGSDIAVDGASNVYVIGSTASTNFPVKDALQPVGDGNTSDLSGDAFVTKIDAKGALVYSTYLGGGSGDGGSSITVDSTGNVYVTGVTISPNFPTRNAFQPALGGTDGYSDAFVAKINARGNALLYSTYLGGDAEEGGNGIAVDGAGNAYLTGLTGSPNFPTKNALQSGAAGGGAFVTKLNAQGSALVYSTYLGGSNFEVGYGLALDNAGNAYVTGVTASSDFPTKNAVQPVRGVNPFCETTSGCIDTFVTKLNAQGTALVYSTYLGGSDNERGGDIAVDNAGTAYLTGSTRSANFPIKNAVQPTFGGDDDAFITKLNAQGSAFVYSTFLGGNQGDTGSDIAVDTHGTVYVTGQTSSPNFPTARALQPTFGGKANQFVGGDAFVAALNPGGNAFTYSTYLGSSGDDEGAGIALDTTGNAYVTGVTGSPNFPTINAFQPAPSVVCSDENEPCGDAFITKLGPPASQLYIPLVTTAPPPTAAGRGTLAFVRDGNIYGYNLQTKQERLLVTNGRDMQFSRDGFQLAFVRDDGLYLARADGTNMRRIAALAGVQTPRWSDDNTKLLWERASDPATPWQTDEIWTVALPNGTPTKIAAGSDPAWAPDGLRVAYVTAPTGSANRNELRLVNWQGQNGWNVVTTVPPNTPPIGSSGNKVPRDDLSHRMVAPVWNAQGSALYVSAFVLYQALSDFFIWERADTTNGGSIFLSELPGVSSAIASPNRQAVIFESTTASGATSLLARSLDPTVPDTTYAWAGRQATPGKEQYQAPTWSPESNAVATLRCSIANNTCDLVVLASGQTEPQVLLSSLPSQPRSNISWGRGE